MKTNQHNMKRKLQFILALLCLAVNSAWADWEGGTYTATANETINGTINVGTATLTTNSGVEVKVIGSLEISGTLTVTGGGELYVIGSGDAVNGDVIIINAEVEAEGGMGGDGEQGDTGGNGDDGYDGYDGYDGDKAGQGGQGGQGGTGGVGFTGTVTIYGGIVFANGGPHGQDNGCVGSSDGRAIASANSVTIMATEYEMDGNVEDGIILEECYYLSITAPHVVYMTANLANGAYWTTFYNNTGHFIAPEGTQVFAVNLEGTTITMIPIEDRIVNAGQGVVLKQATTSSEATTTIIMTGTSSGGTGNFNNNSLKGTMGGITTDGVNNYYVLGYSEQAGVGFYKLTDDGTIGANKAYLTYTASGGTREFFSFGDFTGIGAAQTNHGETSVSHCYDLQGRRIDGKPATKGIYVSNGKKFIVK